MSKYITPCLALAAMLSGCLPTKDLVKVGYKHEGSNLVFENTSLNLLPGDRLSVWTYLEMEYTGDVAFSLNLEVSNEDGRVCSFTGDPRLAQVKRDEQKSSFEGIEYHKTRTKNLAILIDRPGTYTVKSHLAISGNGKFRLSNCQLWVQLQ
ncbi:MAG: hypothetical protein HYZ16_04295 [Bacteroidetes bacterium]|nr:hypothetical protein [Bacteroidota bacterium]